MTFEVGKFYKTQNGSKVRFIEVDCAGDCVFQVIEGGHGNPAFCGEAAGEDYYVLPDGRVLRSMCVEEDVFGMDIIEPWEGE